MSQKAEELVRHGQPRNHMSTALLMWESTTIAEIQIMMIITNLKECGATPLTHISSGSIVMSQYVSQQ